jgi:hypothetical protein
MSLTWAPVITTQAGFAGRAGDYTVCKVWVGEDWTYEAWHWRECLQAGLRSADAARRVCERHYVEHSETLRV